MKRTILVAAAAVVAFGTGYTGARTFSSTNAPMVRVAAEEGDPCTTEHGSGYMVSSGRGLVCQVGGQS